MCQRRHKSVMLSARYGRIEVLEELEPEHAAEAHRHVRVAGEIEVDLERVSQHADPGVQRHTAGRR